MNMMDLLKSLVQASSLKNDSGSTKKKSKWLPTGKNVKGKLVKLVVLKKEDKKKKQEEEEYNSDDELLSKASVDSKEEEKQKYEKMLEGQIWYKDFYLMNQLKGLKNDDIDQRHALFDKVKSS